MKFDEIYSFWIAALMTVYIIGVMLDYEIYLNYWLIMCVSFPVFVLCLFKHKDMSTRIICLVLMFMCVILFAFPFINKKTSNAGLK